MSPPLRLLWASLAIAGPAPPVVAAVERIEIIERPLSPGAPRSGRPAATSGSAAGCTSRSTRRTGERPDRRPEARAAGRPRPGDLRRRLHPVATPGSRARQPPPPVRGQQPRQPRRACLLQRRPLEQRSDRSGGCGQRLSAPAGLQPAVECLELGRAAGASRLQIELPIATDGGAPITGPSLRSSWSGWTRSAPFMWGNSRGYPPVSLDAPDARSRFGTSRTARVGRSRAIAGALPVSKATGWCPIPPRCSTSPGSSPGGSTRSSMRRGSRVVGLGLAAIRDAISFFRFETEGAGVVNPLAEAGAPAPETALIFGISQSGRVIQHMLWQTLHVDEAGRMVFDGALIHVAGAGKGSFNHRFAQTTRHPSHLEDQQYPADFFPFTTTPARDPVTGTRATCSSARVPRAPCRTCSIRPPRPNTGRARHRCSTPTSPAAMTCRSIRAPACTSSRAPSTATGASPSAALFRTAATRSITGRRCAPCCSPSTPG